MKFFKSSFWRVLIFLFFLVLSVCRGDYGTTVFSSQFGGSGIDEVQAVTFTSQGKLLIGGTTSDASTGVFSGSEELLPGDGFLALIDMSGKLEWVKRFCPVISDGFRLAEPREDIILVCCEQQILKIHLEGTGVKILNQTDSDGSPREKFDIIPKQNGDYDVVYLSGARWLHVYDRDLVKLGPGTRVERDHVMALGVDHGTGHIYVGGDQNTNTGYEPYRSPFAWRFTYNSTHITRDVSWELYNYPGSAVRDCGGQCTDRGLQSDSFFREFQYLNQTMWFVAGSDGGNTVFRREPDDLTKTSDFADNSCYSGPCFGYKGAKNPHFFGSMKSDYSGFQRGSWIVPYLGLDECSNCATKGRADPCKCLSTPSGPNSIRMKKIFLHTEDDIIVLSDSFSRPAETSNAWFYDALYDGSGQTYISIFDKTLSTIKMGTMLPNSNGPKGGAYRDGLLAVVGRSKSSSAPSSLTPEGNEWTYVFPQKNPVQQSYGGGDSDGFIFVRCLKDSGDCNAAITDVPINPGSTSSSDTTGNSETPEDESGSTLISNISLFLIVSVIFYVL